MANMNKVVFEEGGLGSGFDLRKQHPTETKPASLIERIFIRFSKTPQKAGRAMVLFSSLFFVLSLVLLLWTLIPNTSGLFPRDEFSETLPPRLKQIIQKNSTE